MAYTSLLSLSQILEQNLRTHLVPQIKQKIETLLQETVFLLDFLEKSSHKASKKLEQLENKIIYLAYKSEDIIEFHNVNRLVSQSASYGDDSQTTLEQALEKLIEEMDTIKQEVMQIEVDVDESDHEHDLQSRMNLSPAGSSSLVPIGDSTMVGLGDDLMEIKTWLVRNSLELEFISIVGMGGIGKTTLARKAYDDPFSIYYFDVRIWATVSEEYNVRNILIDLFDSKNKLSNEILELSDEEVGERLYKKLKGMRYLIVLDDVWDVKVVDIMNRFFPNDRKRSRIMITTRQENVGGCSNYYPHLHRVRFLNENESWNLFCNKAFGKSCCPLELKEIGRKIVHSCRGLPLAIVVIGGLLYKAEKTKHYWRYVSKNLHFTLTSEDEQCSRVLSLSYKHLPHHLKGCFLYMGIFPEDSHIRVSQIVNLWVAEGILKPIRNKTLEEVGEEYLMNLIERGLVLVGEKSFNGKIKTCKMHDVLRNLCLKQAEKNMFAHTTSCHLIETSKTTSSRRVIVRHGEIILNHDIDMSSGLLPRSFFFLNLSKIDIRALISNFRLVKVFYLCADLSYLPTDLLDQLFSLRYLDVERSYNINSNQIFPSVCKLKHLQTLIVPKASLVSMNVWVMQELRHLRIRRIKLLDPPSSYENPFIILENLQTLTMIMNFRCTDTVVERIPNIKKLGIYYADRYRDFEYYCLNNLVYLKKLEELKCEFCHPRPPSLTILTFPPSLKSLTLIRGFHSWEDLTIVGSLPNLQVLKLKRCALYGPIWEPNEGEFLRLQFLLLDDIEVKEWRTEAIHFPRLERLLIKNCKHLEIPISIGEIPTLKSIEVFECGNSVSESAMQIHEEQKSWGNEDLQVFIDGSVTKVW